MSPKNSNPSDSGGVGRKVLFNLLIVLLSFALTIGALELGLRLFYPQQTYRRVVGLAPDYYRASDVLTFELRRNYSGQVYSQEAGAYITVTTNTLGFRDEEFAIEKPADTYRILALGDSFTFGYAINDGEEYPAILETCLNESGDSARRFEVINAGFADGSSPDSYYVFLDQMAGQYQPDMVLVGYFTQNDFAEIAFSTWTAGEHGLPATVQSVGAGVDEFGHFHSFSGEPRYQIPILRNSHLFQLLVDRNLIVLNPAAEPPPDDSDPGIGEGEIIHVGDPVIRYTFEDIFRQELPTQLEETFPLSMQLLEAMHRISVERSYRYAVLLLPAGIQTDRDEWVSSFADLPFPASPAEANPQARISRFLDENDIAYLDLLPTFWETGGEYYYAANGHWTAEGNALAAEAICDYVLDTLGTGERE